MHEDTATVVAMVNNTLTELWNALARIEKNGITDAQYKLLIVIENLIYNRGKDDNADDNTKEILKELESFKDESIGWGCPQYFFNRLLSSLEYSIIFEEEGIEGLNNRINELVAKLRTPELSREETQEPYYKLNHLLRNLIYVCPHVVKSIVVKIKSGAETEERTEELWKTFGGDYSVYRRFYGDLLQLHLEKHGVEHNRELVFSLPYWFTTGTHGSGERAAFGASCEEVKFDWMRLREGRGAASPALAAAIKRPLITYDYTYFTLDEVESIQLSDRVDFTPWYSDFRDNGEREKLVDRLDYLNYYLVFREFCRCPTFRKREQMEVSDEEWERCCKDLLEPHFNSNLWKEDWRSKVLDSGFLADCREDEEVVLYELTDIKLPRKDSYVLSATLFVEIMRRNEEILKHVTVHRGDGIIQRLLEIPVSERHF